MKLHLFLLIAVFFGYYPVTTTYAQEITENKEDPEEKISLNSIQPTSVTSATRKIILVGTRGSDFTYTHTQNTEETQNAYQGRSTNDVFYRVSISTPMTLEISHCDSEVTDTYVHLLDANFERIAYNDDYTGTGACTNTQHSYLKRENLPKGIYYVVSEGYGRNGNITTTIKGTLPPPTIIDLGSKGERFTYQHTENTNNTANSYVGNSTNDVFYKVTLTQKLGLEILHCRSQLASTNMYLLNENFERLFTGTRSPAGICNNAPDQAYMKFYYLDPGVYYIVSEGKTENGSITTNIWGSLPPSNFNVGSKSRPFTYTHTQNTANTTNVYPNLPTNDVFYKVVLTEKLGLEISHCGSAVTDTYLSVLNDRFELIGSNDNHVGTGQCSNTQHAYLKFNSLNPGTYYIVSESKNTNGNITTSIKGILPPPNIIEAGQKTGPFIYYDKRDTKTSYNAYEGQAARDLFYRIRLDHAMDIEISHCGSDISDTYLHLLDNNFQRIVYNDDYSGEGACSNTRHAYLKRANLAAGTYYVVSEGYGSNNGYIATTIKGMPSNAKIFNVGSKNSDFNYTHTQDTRTTTNTCGQPANDVYYKFTLTHLMDVVIKHCNSEVSDTYMHLFDEDYRLIGSNNDYSGTEACGNTKHAFIKKNKLPPGTYYVVSEGFRTENGKITTNISGNIPPPATVDVGSKGSSFSFCHTKDTRNSWNAYEGRPTNDVHYKLTLTKPMDIIISHCGSEVLNTYLTLLNSNYERIAFNSDYLGVETCSESAGLAYLRRNNLAAGTYYIVSEGYSTNGKITTTIEGVYTLKENQKAADSNKNYIKTLTPLVRTSNPGQLKLNECMETVQYFDGLGRSTQTIQVGITPTHKNLVSFQEYDEYGRESKSWLPASISSSNAHPVSQITSSSINYHMDSHPYTEITYEDSPLNRIVKTIGVGKKWHDNDRGIHKEYMVNTKSGELSATYYTDYNGAAPVADGTYDAGELFIEKTTDEEQNVSYVFTDKLGQVILERKMYDTSQINTYYVYDAAGNLIYVISPGGLVYGYKYDERNRRIYMKQPDTQPVYYVYDKSDRLVISQDGNQRVSQMWTVYKYDRLGRLLYTAEMYHANTHQQLRDYWKNRLMLEEFSTGTLSFPMEDTGYSRNFYHLAIRRLLTVNYYDTHDFLELLPAADKTALTYKFQSGYSGRNTNTKGKLTGTRTYLFNGVSGYVATAYYYDLLGNQLQVNSSNHLRNGYERSSYKWTFTGKPESHRKILSAPGREEVTENYFYTYDHADRVKRVIHQINNHERITISENFYDEKGLLQSKLLLGSKDMVDYTYNIRGWLTNIYNRHFLQNITYGGYNANITTSTWRMGTETFFRRYEYKYDKLNRLTTAEYWDNKSGSYTKTDDYTVRIGGYDSRGNILSLTRYGAYQLPSGPTGNPSTGIIDRLTMTYSGNKLTQVSETAPYDPVYKGAMHLPSYDDYTNGWTFTYDANGNMISDNSKQISSIKYNLLNLPDHIIFSGASPKKINYLYDAAGVKRQVTHSIIVGSTAFNTPAVAEMGLKGERENEFFSVDDNILSASTSLVSEENSIEENPGMASTGLGDETFKVTDYCGNVIYTGGVLDKIITPEGYITRGAFGKLVYHYYIKDHLGNNRVVIDQQGTIEQVNHYYPFGALFGVSTDNSGQLYKYNGKELDRMFGLDMYDYEARGLNSVLGRFTSIDPLAEKLYDVSPYAYCLNNPIGFIDPDGKWGFPFMSMQTPLMGTSNPVLLGSSNPVKVTPRTTSAPRTTNVPRTNEHHVVPRQMKGTEVVESAQKGGFKFEGSENKMTLEQYSKTTGQGRHGNHPKYNEHVRKEIDKFTSENKGYSSKKATKFLKDLIKDLKETIEANPDTKINDLYKIELAPIVHANDNTTVINEEKRKIENEEK